MNAPIIDRTEAIIAKLADATRTDPIIIADIIADERKRLNCLQGRPDRLTIAELMLRWYEHAKNDIPSIRAIGLAAWVGKQSRAKVWSTLHGLKAVESARLPF